MWVILRLPEIENGALLSLADNVGEYRIIDSPIKSIVETAVTSKNVAFKKLSRLFHGEILIAFLLKSKLKLVPV